MSETEHPTLALQLKGHRKNITSISFHKDGKQFSSSGEDQSIMVWNLPQTVRAYCFKGHSDVVTGVEYSPNGEFLASCSQDHTVRVWKPTIKGVNIEIKAHLSAVRTVAFSPDSDKIITGSNDKSIKMWKVHNKQFLTSFVGHTNWVRSVKFSQNGDFIASCADDKTIKIWDVRTGDTITTFNTKASPTCLSLHPNDSSVAVAMSSGSVRIYDRKMNKLQQHYTVHDSTTGVCFHPTVNYLLSSGKDGKIKVIDVMEGRPLYTISSGGKGAVSCVRFNESGDQFASGGDDGIIMVWKTFGK